MSGWKGLVRDLSVLRKLAGVLSIARRIRPEGETLYSDLLSEFFSRTPHRAVLIDEQGAMSWRQLDEQANRVAHWAVAEGLQAGDVVALLMENRSQYVAIWLGLSRVGIVTALLNTHLSGERLAHCVREANTPILIVGREMLDAARSAIVHLDGPMRLFVSTRHEEETGGEATDPSHHEELADFDSIVEAQPASAVDPALRKGVRAGDGLFLIYTSGTTGLPKAARISHYKAVVTGYGSARAQELDANDRTYCCLPLYHTAGGVMAVGAALFSGGSLVIARRFSASRFWSDCVQHDVTSFQYIGELCRYLLNSPTHPDERRHRIRTVIGNGLRPEIWSSFQKRFSIPRIVEFYGATEGNMALVNFSGKVGAVGQLPGFLRKLIGIELVRFDVDKEELVRGKDGFCERSDVGEPGEALIKISRTARFEGYTNAESTEKKVLRDAFAKGDAYFRTGDLLRLDDEGYFYFVDRIGDTFRWKGENVATSEVAEVLSVHPGVEEANVYGVAIPGAEGRAGMAALVTREGFEIEELGRHVERELAIYARPLFVRLLPRMEITGTFKHRKVDLVREGYDPDRISDPIYFRDPQQGTYVPLDGELFRRIESGEIRV
jgi:fatty-acyl-CoA synthase